MRTARLLAVLAGVLIALLLARTAMAAAADAGVSLSASPDGGAPPPSAPGRPAGTGAGAPAGTGAPGSSSGAAPAGTGGASGTADGGAPTGGGVDGGAGTAPAAAAASPSEPIVTLPPTAAEQAEGSPIVTIEVVGNRRVARDDVLSYLREKVGHLFKVENLTGDVHALWDSGFFEDIQVDLTTNDRGVVLRFIVRERPNIKEVTFQGNDEIEDDKLTEAIEIKPNTILSVPAVRRSVQKIKDAYAEKGYFLADVTDEIVTARENEVVVKFKIVEHEPVTVRRVTFIGNEHLSDSELRDQMQTGNGGFLSFGSGGPYRQDVFERDVLMLSALYYDKGYLSVQIGTPRVMLTPDRQGIDIAIVIHEGPRFKIRQLRIYERDNEGREIEPLGGRRALRQLIHAESGDFFNRAELIKDLQAVRTLYRDAGFANVEAEPETELDPVHEQVDIVVPIKRGPPVFIERIEVKGNTKTRDKVVRREMEIQEGQLFSETGLENSKKRITALGYFERVDVSTEQGSAPDRLNINVEVAEKPTGTFQVGAGFSSIESFIATAQVQQANLFGNGQSLALQAQVSALRQLVTLRFFEPYFLDSDWNSSVELYDTLYVFPNFARRSVGGSLTFGYALIQPWLRLSVTATTEWDSVDTSSTTTLFGTSTPGFASVFQQLPLANLFNSGRVFSLRPTITYDTRDNRLFPTSGIYLQASTELAAEAFGSQFNYLRHRFTGRFYYPLGGGTGQPGSGFVLKLNTELGLITSPDPQGVPIFQRYFLGGILDVRGFFLRSIGPRLPLTNTLDPNSAPIANGANIGGNLEAYENLELEFPIVDKVGIRGVVFFDSGNAWNTENQFCRTTPAPQFDHVVQPCFSFPGSIGYLRTSTGFGIRWFSPLGPLRFEWGFPLAPLSYENHSDFEFTIGNFF
ncbi:MAG TPA: outer membrane protein assembly factor BamA [Polyangiaceae bacterium]|nr:outer membrane protein assembly factor BamA [Polyangiaceae bacterium]